MPLPILGPKVLTRFSLDPNKPTAGNAFASAGSKDAGRRAMEAALVALGYSL
jgi:hypothetical protein